MTVVFVDYAMEHPYRQPQPLRENNKPVKIGKAGSTLILAESFGRYLSEAMDLAKRGGFSRGTPMIDLTGRSPGLLYAIGAKSIGQAWLFAGYPGSNEFAADALKRVACEELAVAWLLTENGTDTAISADVLSGFGADLSSDYKVVGTLTRPETPMANGGGFPYGTLSLLKPIRSAATMSAACLTVRTGNRITEETHGVP